MTVQDTAPTVTVPTVTVPRQAEPADAPRPGPAADALPSAPLLGRDRPLTADERQFAVGLAVLALLLGTIIVAGLLVGQYASS